MLRPPRPSAPALLACFLLAPAPSAAVPLDVDVWYEAYVTGVDLFATACSSAFCVPGTDSVFAGAPPWTFTTPAGGQSLIVTDGFDYGDIF